MMTVTAHGAREIFRCPVCHSRDVTQIGKSKYPDNERLECRACKHSHRRNRFRDFDAVLLPGEGS